ncbi:MAG: deoxyribodipyrimidine photo-lyase [Bacteroidales bacterium]
MNNNRIKELNPSPLNLQGEYVLYRMQASVRLRHNLALRYAIDQANSLGLPLRILYTLYPNSPEANLRHFTFLVQGLLDFASSASERGYQLVVEIGNTSDSVAKHIYAAAVIVLDRGYLLEQRQWQEEIVTLSKCRVIQVEDNLLVPIETTSDKVEWAARTIRPRIHRSLNQMLEDIIFEYPNDLNDDLKRPIDFSDLKSHLCNFLDDTSLINDRLTPVDTIGGESQALSLFEYFVREKMIHYSTERNNPSSNGSSRISPYLHFGHISPLTLIQMARQGESSIDDRLVGLYQESMDTLIEQLIVRRELAHNWVFYTPNYHNYEALPEWCRTTLAKHMSDHRGITYTIDQLINCHTHEESWNAAMREMIYTGYMENTLRMYWGKKILEWSETPQEAFQRALYLNNYYFLDGRDANSYVGVAWCFGLHDRPWSERPIFGMIRYMNQAGLYRKYDMNSYIAKFTTFVSDCNRNTIITDK